MWLTLCLWPVPALAFRQPRTVFWLSSLIVFVGIRVDTFQHGEIEMGGLVHAACGGAGGYLLWALKGRVFHSRSKGSVQ
jgi:hypothetical protein